MLGFLKKTAMPDHDSALTGRQTAIETAQFHAVNGNPLQGPYPQNCEIAYFSLGCYWGAERKFWQQPGVWVTAVGNIAGMTPNPTYQEVCTGATGHAEAVMVVYETDKLQYDDLLKIFWESHDPTQGMRQGNDVGSQYRSGIYPITAQQHEAAIASKQRYQAALDENRLGVITTEINADQKFYFAEDYHQQYLAKNPQGYCGLGGTGVRCPGSPAE